MQQRTPRPFPGAHDRGAIEALRVLLVGFSSLGGKSAALGDRAIVEETRRVAQATGRNALNNFDMKRFRNGELNGTKHAGAGAKIELIYVAIHAILKRPENWSKVQASETLSRLFDDVYADKPERTGEQSASTMNSLFEFDRTERSRKRIAALVGDHLCFRWAGNSGKGEPLLVVSALTIEATADWFSYRITYRSQADNSALRRQEDIAGIVEIGASCLCFIGSSGAHRTPHIMLGSTYQSKETVGFDVMLCRHTVEHKIVAARTCCLPAAYCGVAGGQIDTFAKYYTEKEAQSAFPAIRDWVGLSSRINNAIAKDFKGCLSTRA